MKSQLAPHPGRLDHPPQPHRSTDAHPVRRVGALDRAAMHLGVALIRWGRRPVTAERARADVYAASHEARQERERLRDQYLVLKLTQFR